MSQYPEYRDQIRCLGLDSERMTVLDGGALLNSVTVEVTDASGDPRYDREAVRVTLSPREARALASQLFWHADRSEWLAAGLPDTPPTDWYRIDPERAR